jgi:hypothetical protein
VRSACNAAAFEHSVPNDDASNNSALVVALSGVNIACVYLLCLALLASDAGIGLVQRQAQLEDRATQGSMLWLYAVYVFHAYTKHAPEVHLDRLCVCPRPSALSIESALCEDVVLFR